MHSADRNGLNIAFMPLTYEPGDGRETPRGDGGSFVVLLRAEEIEIVKHVRVVEDVRILTRRVKGMRRGAVTLRREILDVDDGGEYVA